MVNLGKLAKKAKAVADKQGDKISNAVDKAVTQIDFRTLSGKPVFFDPQYLDNTVDKGYVTSSLRQQLLASSAHLLRTRLLPAKPRLILGCSGACRRSSATTRRRTCCSA